MIDFANIPTVLQECPQWVLWRTVQRDKPTKVPFQPDGNFAKANDVSTWHTFELVRRAYELGGYDGIGFEFCEADQFCGIDLDGCRNPETGEVAAWAKEIVLKLDTYAEVSPSQTGIKLFAIGKLSSSGRKKELDYPAVSDKTPAIEVYDRGRYFAVTGLRMNGPREPQDRQQIISALVARFWPPPKQVENFHSTSAVVERARAYLAKIPPAVSGNGGHNATFHAACVLVCGFSLEHDQAIGLLREWNQLCQPPWSEHELEHKISDAQKQTCERGYLRNVTPDRWEQVVVPKHNPPAQLKSTTMVDAAAKYIMSVSGGRKQLITLGFPELDYAIGGGVERGEMIIIAGRPSHGKSLVALQIIHHWTSQGIPSLIISEEMSSIAIGKRALQFISSIPEEYWHANISDITQDLTRYAETREKCFIVESARTLEKVTQLVQQHVAEHDVRGVVIDYAQLLSSPGKSRYEQITNTSIALRGLANQSNVTLIALCQLNRAIESRQRFLPNASDLKDSGQLEQDADVVIVGVWPHRVNIHDDPKRYEFFVLKNRNRAINSPMVRCCMVPNRQRVDEVEIGSEWQPDPDGYEQFV